MLTLKFEKYACASFFGPQLVSCPPKNVEKKTPLNGIPEMPGADLLDSTCLPSYKTVIWPVDLFTDCWMEWVLPSVALRRSVWPFFPRFW